MTLAALSGLAQLKYRANWRADDFGDIELLHARYLSYSFAQHTHEGAAFGIIEAGVRSLPHGMHEFTHIHP